MEPDKGVLLRCTDILLQTVLDNEGSQGPLRVRRVQRLWAMATRHLCHLSNNDLGQAT